jgi:signal transduction histidine kinase
MTGSGVLTISVNTLDDAVEIEFHDTGRGIDEETLDHIFQPLFTTKRGRAGVGLSVAHLAMKQQDGSIGVRSRLGEGSTFTLSFKRRTMIRPEDHDGDEDTRRAAHVRRVQ